MDTPESYPPWKLGASSTAAATLKVLQQERRLTSAPTKCSLLAKLTLQVKGQLIQHPLPGGLCAVPCVQHPLPGALCAVPRVQCPLPGSLRPVPSEMVW